MIFALICENKIENRFECDSYEKANMLARASFGDEAFAVNTDRFATSIGDYYVNGIFFTFNGFKEDGTENYVEVQYIPTEREIIDNLQVKFIQSQLVLTDTYEEKLTLENKIIIMQQAITEIYEKMEAKI